MYRARKRFGQNFLIDPAIIQTLICAIAPQAGDSILEIGPGLGALTAPLLKTVDTLEAVELDRDLIEYLNKLATDQKSLIIHACDALKFDFSATARPRRIVGNLPYNISTPMMFHLLDYSEFITDIHIMLQKEVVERICARSGDRNFGRLSVMAQSKCTAQSLIEVPPEKFSPQPKVASAFMRLIPHKTPIVSRPLQPAFNLLVKTCFSQPRKTLANNLKKMLPPTAIKAAGIDPAMRPGNLCMEEFVALASLIKK